MRVGITGSTGFIGQALSESLAARGDTIVRFVRPTSPPVTDALTITWMPDRGDIDEHDLRRVGELDAIVHLAGAGVAEGRWTSERKDAIRASRVDSTATLVNAISSSRLACGYLASGSAIGFYGSRGDEVLDESSSAGSDFLARVCVEWEAATSPLTQRGVPVALLRTGIVLSRRGGALKKQLGLFKAGLGGQLGPGTQWMSPISMVDEIGAITYALDQRLSGPLNLTCPNPLTNRDFTVALARRLHRPSMLRVPGAALRALFGAELVADALLASQRVVPSELLAHGYVFESPDCDAMIEAALTA